MLKAIVSVIKISSVELKLEILRWNRMESKECTKVSLIFQNHNMEFKCSYCVFTCCTFSEIIDHNIIRHPLKELKIKKLTFLSETNTSAWQSKNFKVIPHDVRRQGSFIYVEDNDRDIIKISKLHAPSPQFSPASKKVKHVHRTSTPLKTTLFKDFCFDIENSQSVIHHIDESHHKQLNAEKVDDEMDISFGMTNLSITDTEDNVDEDETNSNEFKELCNLFPKVIENLKNADQLETYMQYNRMVADNSFPLQNIAYLLFLDVVNWFSNETTSQMRYSEDVRKFWRVGLKLFKGKFIRFMSGLKNSGQLYDDIDKRGLFKPSDSKINFAVPSRSILEKMRSPMASSEPGILTEMITAMSNADKTQIETFKMCVDGKKLNAGVQGQKLGDINLWGFEDNPTLQERQLKLDIDLSVVSKIKDILDSEELKDTNNLMEVSETSKDLATEIKNSLSVLSTRIHDLRKVKVGKKIALEKLWSQVTGDWRSSKFAFAISSLKTRIYEIDACVVDLLNVVNYLGQAISIITETNSSYQLSNTVELACQNNYVCLVGIESQDKLEHILTNETLCVVQQKSEAWFSARKSAVVTGSTIYKALGFDGLKKQQSHYNVVYCNAESAERDVETLKRMQHGTINEINAVATLVSKVLPVYFPEHVFVEEGCYMIQGA